MEGLSYRWQTISRIPERLSFLFPLEEGEDDIASEGFVRVCVRMIHSSSILQYDLFLGDNDGSEKSTLHIDIQPLQGGIQT